MFTLDLKLGYTCNNKCIHCIIEGNKQRLINKKIKTDKTTKECLLEIDEGVKQFKNLGYKSGKIVITGGEPTIRKDFFEICDYAYKSSFKDMSIQTNGRMLSDRKFTKILIDKYPVKFTIALHGDTSEIHDNVTKEKNSFNETVEGLKNISLLGGSAVGKIVISKDNKNSIFNTVKLFNTVGIKKVNIAFPHSSKNDKRFHIYVPKYSDVLEQVILSLEYGIKHEIFIMTEAFPYCLLPKFEEYIGENFIHGDITINDVNNSKTDWQKKRLAIKAKGGQCIDCLINHICEGCWEEYIDNYGSHELKPITNIKSSLIIGKKVKLSRIYNLKGRITC